MADGKAANVRHDAAGRAAMFNDQVPVGTPVTYWPGALAGPGLAGATRSRAWALGGHTPVVMVEGYAGGIHLDHVTVSSTAPQDAGGGRG